MIVQTARRFAHTLAAGLGIAAGLAAAPPLTTIEDVLYRADGTRFNGSATITWPSFEAADSSIISKHSLTVKIVDGQLRVQLVPNAGLMPAVHYTVKYSSDGRIQFEETWSVPPGAGTVRLRDVRVTAPAAIEEGALPLQQSDIVGLPEDLAARPVRGPGFTPGRAAVINATGALEAAMGDPSDCVRVDGTAGPCGTSGAGAYGFIDNETPAGAVDGANTSFALISPPNPPASLAVYRNGLLQKMGFDYVLSDRSITFLPGAVPQPGDTLLASYRKYSPGLTTGAEVLCSGAGLSTTATEPAVLGSCFIAAGTLRAGDRVEMHFSYAREGSGAGFVVEARWSGTALVSRAAEAGESLVTGRADAAVAASATQVSVQTWGAVLPLASGVIAAPESITSPVQVELRGNLAGEGGGVLKLQQYSVVRYPALP